MTKAARVSERKWKAMLLSMSLVTLGFAAIAFSDVLGTHYGTYVMAIGAILTTYGGMNVTSKWVQGKNSVIQTTEEATSEPSKEA